MPARCAIFVDFDNVFTTLWGLDRNAALRFASEPADWLQILANSSLTGEPRRWLVARCYLNPAGYAPTPGEANDRLYFSRFRPSLVRAGFEVIDCPVVSRGGKNAADIRMVVDALDLLGHRTHFDEFVLASGDSDFTPLLQRLRAEDRRITIISPGYLSSAYTAIADRVVDFDGMMDLLAADANAASDGDEQRDAIDGPVNLSDSKAQFAELIRKRYAQAGTALNLAALAFEAARTCPGAKQSGWFGTASFSAAVSALDLPNVRFSQHHMWDSERHEPPTAERSNNGSEFPPPVALLSRELDLPRIEQADWPKVFDVLSRYAKNHEFNLTEATRWCRDTLADEGVQTARNAVGYIMRVAQFGGARLDANVAPEPDDLGRAFLGAVLDRASAIGLTLSPDAEDAVAQWLGIEWLAE